MPRASYYLLQGHTYHLTQRCHDRDFLLRFRHERDVYREWLRVGVARHRVPVYAFSITGNHTHVLVHADNVEEVGRFMHLASGSTAKQYNLRKNRTGSMWQHPYHCTMVEDGRHLMNCLVYINLNMVRAGKVGHPREWKWCSHDELVGKRRRYRILNTERLLESLGVGSKHDLSTWYEEEVESRLAERQQQREAHWTESLAVGSKCFVERAVDAYSNRWTFKMAVVAGSNQQDWAVRETGASYAIETGPKKGL